MMCILEDSLYLCSVINIKSGKALNNLLKNFLIHNDATSRLK